MIVRFVRVLEKYKEKETREYARRKRMVEIESKKMVTTRERKGLSEARGKKHSAYAESD